MHWSVKLGPHHLRDAARVVAVLKNPAYHFKRIAWQKRFGRNSSR